MTEEQRKRFEEILKKNGFYDDIFTTQDCNLIVATVMADAYNLALEDAANTSDRSTLTTKPEILKLKIQ